MEAAGGDVEVELADGDSQAPDPEVAEAEDPAAVRHCAWQRVFELRRLLLHRGERQVS